MDKNHLHTIFPIFHAIFSVTFTISRQKISPPRVTDPVEYLYWPHICNGTHKLGRRSGRKGWSSRISHYYRRKGSMAHILHQVRIRVLKVKLMVCENAYSLYKKEMLSIEPFPFQNSSITYPNMWKPLKAVIYEILQVFRCTLINYRTPRQQCIPFILQYLIL